jgi:glucose/arabinose dehydrogenase
MVVVAGSRVLVVERGEAQVTLLEDRDGDGVVDGEGERRALARAPGLNHGIAVDQGHLYASSPSTVYRWPFSPDAAPPSGLLDGRSTVLQGMPTGGHSTRTLLPKDGHLFVSVGSGSNVDRDSERSRVVRISLDELPKEGFVWDGDGVELWADGLRNEVGLALDGQGRLWGVQNGIDNLRRGDLGGDIHADNPAEELNLLTQPGAFHGYPYCWTEYRLDRGRGRGTQWAHPQSRQRYGDDWCRDPDHVVPPRLAMQAHAAPLDLLFYRGDAFPGSVKGDLYVSFHGSWNRPEPTGYEVIRVPFPDPDHPEAPVPFLRYRGRGATGDAWPHRPVALATTGDGVLLVSSDRSGVVLAVDHRGPDGGDRP